AHAICARKGKVTVYVPHYAMSGGTLIALAADEIVMDPNAVLGSLDPQLGHHPAASIVRAIEWKTDRNQEVDDETVILADVARKAIVQLFECVRGILTPRLGPEKAEELATILTRGEGGRAADGFGGRTCGDHAGPLAPPSEGDDRAPEDLRQRHLGERAVPAGERDQGVARGGDQHVARVAEAGREGDGQVAVGVAVIVAGEDADHRAAALRRAARGGLDH